MLKRHLLATKIVDHAFFCWSAGIKRSHSWPINSTFWPVNKALIWADVWELALPCWTMIRPLLYVFWISPKSLGKQIVMCHSELIVLRWSSGTGDHLLRQASSTNNFRWIWLGCEDPHGGLLLCFGLIRADPWFVICHDLINIFWGTAIIFFQYLGYTNQHEPFLERLSNCAGSHEKKSFFTARCSCNIECTLLEAMSKDAFISRCVTWRSCIISSRTSSMFTGTMTVFAGPSRT